MKTTKYRQIEKDIASHDGGGIFERWKYGRLLLVDDTATTAAGNLQHGVLEQLITAANRDGIKLSDREIRRRIQVARTYPTREQIGHVVADFKSWHDLAQAALPEVSAPDDARPNDQRTTTEMVRAHRRSGGRLPDNDGDHEQGQFDFGTCEATDTLAEIGRWLDEQDAITARFADLSDRRRVHYEDLVKATAGDLSQTWEQAEKLLGEP